MEAASAKTSKLPMSVNILLASSIYSEKVDGDDDNLLDVAGLPTKEFFLKSHKEAYDGTLVKQIRAKIRSLFKKALEDNLKDDDFQSELFDIRLPKRRASSDRLQVISITKSLKTEIDISSMRKTLQKYYPHGDSPDYMMLLKSMQCPTFIPGQVGRDISPIVLKAGDWKIRPIISSDYCFIIDIQMEIEIEINDGK